MKSAVGQDSYVDFSKDMDFDIEPSKEELKSTIQNIEKQTKFITWVQSFTKKTVTILFGLYILCTLISILMMFLGCYVLGQSVNMDTFIVENNETFRIVIGGYLIKAAVENGIKISGNYYLGISNARLNILRKKYNLSEDSPDIDIDIDSDEEYFRGDVSDTTE
jgi:hypothetical protein